MFDFNQETKQPKFIDGYIKSKKDITFRDEKKGYTIAKFINNNDQKVNIKGYFPEEVPNWVIRLYIKNETRHPQFWITYEFEHFDIPTPKWIEQLKLFFYVSFWLTKNQTNKLMNFFDKSEKILELIDKHLEEFWDEEKLGFDSIKLFSKHTKYKAFKKKWIEESIFRELRYYLSKYWIVEWNIRSIVEKYKTQALQKIKENPYILLTVEGISFHMADKIFLENGWDITSLDRILAWLPHVVKEGCNNTKWLFLYFSYFLHNVQNLLWLKFSEEVLLSYVNLLDNRLTNYNKEISPPLIIKEHIVNGQSYKIVYLYKYYNWEEVISDTCFQANNSNFTKIDLSNENWEIDWRKLNPEQQQAVINWINSKISIITWQGWTWKSTIIKKIIQILSNNTQEFNWTNIKKKEILKLKSKISELNKIKDKDIEKIKVINEKIEKLEKKKPNAFKTYTLLAPTGKAVDVLIDISGKPDHCSTIHRKTGIKWQEWIIAPESISELVTIVDEASMIAMPLMYSLITAIDWFINDPQKRLILVWDDNQLPPINLGKPFLDMLESKIVPTIKLTKVYRQKEGSRILDNCQSIVDKTQFKLEQTEDFKFFDIKNYSAQKIQNELLWEIKRNKWNNKDDVILTFQKKWLAWINEINKVMQDYLNVNNWEMYYEKWLSKFFIWDRIMQKTNWYRTSEEGKELHKEGYPVSLMIDKEKQEKLSRLFTEQSNSDTIPEVSSDFKSGFEPFSKNIIYNNHSKSFINMSSLKTIWTYIDWKIDTFAGEDFEWDIDRNVYNWNWGIVVWAKTALWWYWINEISWKTVPLNLREILPPNKKDNKDEYVILVKFNNQYVFYNRETISDITLFYASSVHKSQGSQFKNVYALNLPSDSFWTDRYWLYTQLSRAQEKIYYFSTLEATNKAQFKEWSLTERTGLLKEKLISKLKNYEKITTNKKD